MPAETASSARIEMASIDVAMNCAARHDSTQVDPSNQSHVGVWSEVPGEAPLSRSNWSLQDSKVVG